LTNFFVILKEKKYSLHYRQVPKDQLGALKKLSLHRD